MFNYLTSIILAASVIFPTFAQNTINTGAPPAGSLGQARWSLEAPRSPLPTVKDYAVLRAQENGLDPDKFEALIECESQWDTDALGDNGTSFGILQFKETTFAQFSAKYMPGDELEFNDPHDQIDLAVSMIEDGYLHHWKRCSKKIGWANN